MMTTRSTLVGSLAFAVTLTLAGSAFARRPAPLENAQNAAAEVLATCDDAGQRGSLGYRDILARTSAPSEAKGSPVANARMQRMADHVVLTCAGGRVHASGGYRDLDVRFRVDDSLPVVATTPRFLARR